MPESGEERQEGLVFEDFPTVFGQENKSQPAKDKRGNGMNGGDEKRSVKGLHESAVVSRLIGDAAPVLLATTVGCSAAGQSSFCRNLLSIVKAEAFMASSTFE